MKPLFKKSVNEIEKYLDNPPPEVVSFEGKKFCLTGKFDSGTQPNYEEKIKNHGGIINNEVTQTTNYLVVGNKGHPTYDLKGKTNKLKRAKEFQEREKISIFIIRESHCTWFFEGFKQENIHNKKIK